VTGCAVVAAVFTIWYARTNIIFLDRINCSHRIPMIMMIQNLPDSVWAY
jgi:hypothetical protein